MRHDGECLVYISFWSNKYENHRSKYKIFSEEKRSTVYLDFQTGTKTLIGLTKKKKSS